MRALGTKGTQVSFRRAATLTMAVMVVPLFIAIVLFDSYTVAQQQSTLRSYRRGTLQLYQAQWDETLDVTEDFLMETLANDTEFSMVLYAGSKTEVHVASEKFDDNCRTLLRSQELLGAFFLYSQPHDYYRLIYTISYPQEDLALLRETVKASLAQGESVSRWFSVSLSDRTVLVFASVRHGTVVAAMVDPAQLTYTGLEENGRVFFAQPNGTAYSPENGVGEEGTVRPEGRLSASGKDGRRYELISQPLARGMGSVVYAVPAQTFWEQLSPVQIALLAFTAALLGCIPLCWLTLRRLLLEPVGTLTTTMRSIQQGEPDIRVPQDSRIQEVNQIAGTVNTMLDEIQRRKIASYEQQLAVQQAQLQYLHLQIRPHFFLNCLNLVYSLAGEGKTGTIQDLVLDLSTYLRSVFKDGSKLVPLQSELASAESYVRIQQAGTDYPPQLRISMDAEAAQALVPSLSLLTFVENAIKHSRRQDSPLLIQVRCSLLPSEEGDYLNVSIWDNGGGFLSQQLEELNHGGDPSGRHVGIANIRQRLRLQYGARATVSFRNRSEGACVELFLPIEQDRTEGETL